MEKIEKIKKAQQILTILAEQETPLEAIKEVFSIANVLLMRIERKTPIDVQLLNSACEEYISSISESKRG